MPTLYKQLTVFIFLASFVAHTIGNGFFIADYYLHPEKYAKNCINKSRPKLQCNGKCQLMKKIEEEEKKEKANNEKEISVRTTITLTDKNYFVIIEDNKVADKPIQRVYKNTIALNSFTSSVFRPPC